MRYLIPFLFITVFLGILVAANIYLIHRFNLFFSPVPSYLFSIIFPALTLLMFFGMMPLSNATSLFASSVYRLAAIVMGSLLFLLITTAFVDLLRIFTHFPEKYYGLATLGLSAILVVFSIVNSYRIKTREHDVVLAGLNTGMKAMHWSDVHLGHFRGKNFLQKIVDKTNAQKPDLVLLTGDLFDGRIRLNKESLAPLKDLQAPLFFVEGNHDKYTGVSDVKTLLRNMGVYVLENEIKEWGGLQIIGLNHMRADSNTRNIHVGANGTTISSTLDSLKPDPNRSSILMHHSPDGVEYASKHGIDLYLSGHTHAGQIWPVKYIAAMMFRFNEGMHQFKNTKLYVSHGTGTFGPPMRLGTQSEISLFRLKPQLN